MRHRPRGRRSAALAVLLALALAAPLSLTATQAGADSAERPAPSADDIRQYEIHRHTTAVTRTAIQRSGVTVDEADEETVVVS
ncbi:zinc carboxypeptidase, partial [Streptomyces caniscabiei]